MSFRLLCYTLLFGFTGCSVYEALDPVVAAPAGRFRGKILTSASGNTFASYRGIPYALPPTGDHRFALPEAFPKIEGYVYDASEFGPVCVQHVNGVSYGEEDCLYLNVYAPLIDRDAAGVEQRKVLVFIHGGGFILGSASMYIPGDLVTQGDVLVVTLNYRLGWLGFLRGDPELLPGNQAFHDQVLALKWVQENIAAFGGDPNDVTLSGESAGAISVSILSISPLTRDLFNKDIAVNISIFQLIVDFLARFRSVVCHCFMSDQFTYNAIVMSGTAFSFPTPPQQSRDLLDMVQKNVDCENKDNIISCLQLQPADRFEMPFTYATIVKLTSSGDALLPRPIPELINDPEYLNSVGFFNRDYIVSITKHDGYIRINSVFGKLNITSVETSIQDISQLLHLPKYVTESLLLEYLRSYEDLEKAIIALNTDYFYLQRSNYFLNTFARRSSPGAPSAQTNIYFLSFDPVPKYFPNQYVVHAMDLVYLFDLDPKKFLESAYFLEIDGGFSEDDLQVKSAFIELLATFVKTGNPNDYLRTKKSIIWPPYDETSKNYLSFSLQPSVRQNLYGDRHIIWDQLVPRWKKEFESLQSKQEL